VQTDKYRAPYTVPDIKTLHYLPRPLRGVSSSVIPPSTEFERREVTVTGPSIDVATYNDISSNKSKIVIDTPCTMLI